MKRHQWRLVKSLFIAVLMIYSGIGFAAACVASVPAGLNFGNYNPFSVIPDDATDTVNVNCSFAHAAVNFSLAVSRGQSDNYLVRKMFNGGHSLIYNLFTGAGYNAIWGDGTNGSSIIAGVCSPVMGNCHQAITIFARIPPQQTQVPAGYYHDILMITVNY